MAADRDPDLLAIRGGRPSVPEGLVKPWPPIEEIDRQMVMASLEGDNHSFGPNCRAFAEEFAEWNGNRFAINTNSGTAALHMGVAACGCGLGDEVIVPAYSWSSSATAVLHHDAIPVFVDIDWRTMNIDPELIEAAVSPKTKAILVAHLHGLMADMEAILAVAERHGLFVIEDACQAHGARLHNRKAGTWGHCAAFSFNKNKSLCSGEGGMFVTDDEHLFEKAKQLWSFGETRAPDEERDNHAYALGWMYRSNDLTAAFGRAQLRRLDSFLDIQRQNCRHLLGKLPGTFGLTLPEEPSGFWHTWYNVPLRLDIDALGLSQEQAPLLRDKVVAAINAEGLPHGSAWPWQQFILPAMTVFQAKNAYGHGHPWSSEHSRPVSYDPARFPVAQRHVDRSFCISKPLRAPNGPDVATATADAIRRVMDRLDQLI